MKLNRMGVTTSTWMVDVRSPQIADRVAPPHTTARVGHPGMFRETHFKRVIFPLSVVLSTCTVYK